MNNISDEIKVKVALFGRINTLYEKESSLWKEEVMETYFLICL